MAYKIYDDCPHCLECGDPISYGRSDRKFCSEQCKNHYHNKHKELTSYGYKTKVLGILEKNYSILGKLLKMEIRSMDKGDLARLGYNFDYLTGCRKVGHRTECRCFEYKYIDTPSRIVNLEHSRYILADCPEKA